MATANSTGSSHPPQGSGHRRPPDPKVLEDFSSRAWSIYNILSFMVEAVDDDATDGLPVRCTLVDMRQMVYELASGLGNASYELSRDERHG
ncbi:TPA: hypothetical protein QDA98_000764 [Burkholderia vietnamiensis]|nr:hypothetical protein [Burkholderia vietnamiensis]